MQIEWLQMLDEHWDEKDTSYSDDFYLWPDWLFQYHNELSWGEVIESAYLMWKSGKNTGTQM